MRSQKIRLKLTKEQENLAWWYSILLGGIVKFHVISGTF